MDCSMPGFPVHHQLPELAQTQVHWVGDAIQPSHPLSSPSAPAFSLPQHQGLFQGVSSSHQVAFAAGWLGEASLLPLSFRFPSPAVCSLFKLLVHMCAERWGFGEGREWVWRWRTEAALPSLASRLPSSSLPAVGRGGVRRCLPSSVMQGHCASRCSLHPVSRPSQPCGGEIWAALLVRLGAVCLAFPDASVCFFLVPSFDFYSGPKILLE